MKVRYRASGEVTDLTAEAAHALIDAGICDAVDDANAEPTRDAPLLTPEAPLATTAIPSPGRRRR